MKKSELRMYLRSKLHLYWRPVVIKDCCEHCGSKENLELHHKSDRFKDIISNVLNEFGYNDDTKLKDIHNIELIVDVILGRHLYIKHITLCSDCHIKEHQRLSNKYNRKLFEDIEFPKEFLDIPLTTKEKDLIVEYYDLYNDNNRRFKWPGIKSKIIKSEKYIVSSGKKKINGKQIRYDLIRKINKDLKGGN